MFARKWLILGAALLAILAGGLKILLPAQAASQITVSVTLSSTFVPADGASTLQVTARVFAGTTTQSFRQIRWGITGSGSFASPPPTDTGLLDSAQATFVAGTAPGRPQITVTDTQSQMVGTATVNQYGSATSLAISLAQPQVVADGKSTVVATMTATDAAGVGVPVENVSLAARSSSTGSVSVGAVTNNHDGTYSSTITAGTVADIETLTATDRTPATAHTASTTLTEIPGPPAKVGLSIAPATLTAGDTTHTSTATVTVTDAFNNARTSDSVAFHTDGHVTFAPTAGTPGGGYATTITASTVAGVEHITATDGTATSAPVALTVGPAAAANITFAVGQSTLSTTASPPASTTATATVTDTYGNPVPGEHVSITGQGPAQVSAVTDNHNGAYTATVTATPTPGVTRLSAEDPSVTVTTGTTATAVVRTASVTSLGPPATIRLGLAPAYIHAGVNNSTIATANVQDSAGDAVPGVTVTFASASGDLTFSNQGTGTTDAGGNAHVQVNGAAYAGPQKVYVTGANLTTWAVLTEYDTPVHMAVSISPATMTADGAATATAVVTITDGIGDGVPGQTFTLTRTGTGTLGPAADNGDGTYRVVVVSSTTAQTETLRIHDGTAQLDASTTFTEVPGPPATVTVTPNPASMVADGHATTVLTAIVGDAHGNRVAGQAVGFRSSGHASFGAVTAGSDGTYTVTATAGTVAGTETVTATDSTPAQPISGTATLTMLPGTPTHLTVTPGAASLVADGHSTTAITVRIEDANANGVYGEHPTVSTTGDLASAITDNGDGTYTLTLTASTTADSETVTVGDGALGGSVQVTENPGPAAHVTVSTPTPTISTDQTSGVTFTATVTDANGNAVRNDSIHFAGDGGVTFPGAVTAGGDGTYTATATPSTRAGTRTITATDASVTSTVVSGTATLTETPGAPASLTLAQTTGRMTADGTSTTPLLATVTDRNHNGVPGQLLGVTAAVDGGGTPGITSAVTDNGDGTYTVTLTSGTRADVETVTVSDAAAGGGTTASATITQVAGPAASVAVALTANSTVTANGSDQRTVTVTVTDANGNPVAGDPVTLTASGAATLASSSLTTAAGGTASTLVTASTKAGREAITATDGTTHVQGSATLTENPGPAASISVSAPGSTLIDDGRSTMPVSALVRDANGNPIPGEQVTFSVAGNLVSVSPATAAADGTGTAVTTVRARMTTGTETVTAADAGNGALSGSVTLTLADQDTIAGFVKAAYQTLLGRTVDADGLAYWSGRIRGGMSRPQFAATITSSTEYRTNLVSRMYRPYLHRASDSAGVGYWVGQIANGATIEQVRLSFIGSPEYFQVHGGTSKGAVDALYLDVLGRPVDSAGEQYWVQQLDGHQLSFSQLAASILYSEEGREHLVAGIYQDVLGRSAPSGDLAYWAGQLRNGTRDEAIVNLFVGSPEYFASIH